ncbi:MAG TPA: YtxH domain-containing protein [Terriglobales bacterium]|jgi:gas vesicle protein|nr:YtxH domain-containing protein [Terriglobales bacterium]
MRVGKYEVSEANNTAGTAVTFLLIGLGIGAATALMFAPKTGKEMRKDLRRGYDDARERFSDLSENARESFRERAADAKERFDGARETLRDRIEDALDRGAELADSVREKSAPFVKSIRRS